MLKSGRKEVFEPATYAELKDQTVQPLGGEEFEMKPTRKIKRYLYTARTTAVGRNGS